METHDQVDFWKTVEGGALGYLHRVQESLRTSGVNSADSKKVKRFLGDEVFARYNEAGQIAREQMTSSEVTQN